MGPPITAVLSKACTCILNMWHAVRMPRSNFSRIVAATAETEITVEEDTVSSS